MYPRLFNAQVLKDSASCYQEYINEKTRLLSSKCWVEGHTCTTWMSPSGLGQMRWPWRKATFAGSMGPLALLWNLALRAASIQESSIKPVQKGVLYFFGLQSSLRGKESKRSRAYDHQESALSILNLIQGTWNSLIPCQHITRHFQGLHGTFPRPVLLSAGHATRMCASRRRGHQRTHCQYVHPQARHSQEQLQPKDLVRTWTSGLRCPDSGTDPCGQGYFWGKGEVGAGQG